MSDEREEGQLGPYAEIGLAIGELVDVKNEAYGDSFNKCSAFLELLYPNGVPVSAYRDMLSMVRIFDKQMRIATDRDALGEDPFRDIGGYAVLAVRARSNGEARAPRIASLERDAARRAL